MTTPICFVDCESDGVHHDRRAWDIAIIRRTFDDTGAVAAQTETQFYLPLPDLAAADGFALRLGGYWDRHPDGRILTGKDPASEGRPHVHLVGPITSGALVTPYRAALEIVRLTHDADLVASNPHFDLGIFENLLHDHELLPTWQHHPRDIADLAIGYLAGRGELPPRPWKSTDLSRLIGVAPPHEIERHTALGDARWVMRVYDKVTGGAA